MKHVYCLALALFFTGCASSYKPINRKTIDYLKSRDGSVIQVAYRYNVLAESDNVKYDRKARLNGVNVIAAKTKNNSSRPINSCRPSCSPKPG